LSSNCGDNNQKYRKNFLEFELQKKNIIINYSIIDQAKEKEKGRFLMKKISRSLHLITTSRKTNKKYKISFKILKLVNLNKLS